MAASQTSTTIFSDRIFTSTEMNRASGKVLDAALENPVTITRNNDSFALVKRELMANMAKGIEQTHNVSRLVGVVLRLASEQEIESDNEFKWVEEFDGDERLELVDEVFKALNLARLTDDWDEIAAVMYEWRESAIAIASDELAEAFDK